MSKTTCHPDVAHLVWCYRYPEWENRKTSILWVTGFAGSGKTTLAKTLSEANETAYVQFDVLITRLMAEGLTTEPQLIEGINKELSSYHRVIVEGLQAPFFITENSSFLLMRHGFFESTRRAGKRRGSGVLRDTFMYAKTNLSLIGEMTRLKRMVQTEPSLENVPPSFKW